MVCYTIRGGAGAHPRAGMGAQITGVLALPGGTATTLGVIVAGGGTNVQAAIGTAPGGTGYGQGGTVNPKNVHAGGGGGSGGGGSAILLGTPTSASDTSKKPIVVAGGGGGASGATGNLVQGKYAGWQAAHGGNGAASGFAVNANGTINGGNASPAPTIWLKNANGSSVTLEDKSVIVAKGANGGTGGAKGDNTAASNWTVVNVGTDVGSYTAHANGTRGGDHGTGMYGGGNGGDGSYNPADNTASSWGSPGGGGYAGGGGSADSYLTIKPGSCPAGALNWQCNPWHSHGGAGGGGSSYVGGAGSVSVASYEVSVPSVGEGADGEVVIRW